MEAGHRGEVDRSQSTKAEWNWNVEMKCKGEYLLGEEGHYEVKLKGRCKNCWGELIAKGLPTPAPTAIRCLVCGILLEGEAASEEFQRMSEQEASISFKMGLHRSPPEYRDDATFVYKTFPYSLDEICEPISGKASQGRKGGGWLTRDSFPEGSPGLLFMQAKLLMSGVERLSMDSSVVRLPDIDLNDDGSATVRWSDEQMGEHPKIGEYETMKRLGSNMTIAMMSAFACELAMKAICLTRKDKARKSHDLWKLYGDLPTDSKERIEQDFSEIASVLETARHTFGNWRYFETNIGERSMSTMIDTDRAFFLAKAARVLIDEAAVVGLSFLIDLEANKTITKIDGQRDVHVKHNLSVKGREHLWHA